MIGVHPFGNAAFSECVKIFLAGQVSSHLKLSEISHTPKFTLPDILEGHIKPPSNFPQSQPRTPPLKNL
jgi:hypothetical protein